MKINKKKSLQQFLPLSEAEIQGLLHPAHPVLDIFLRGFSLSSCPQHNLKVLLLLNPLYSTVNRIFHFSYSDPDYLTSELTATGLARV
jgi:hypothetical protein